VLKPVATLFMAKILSVSIFYVSLNHKIRFSEEIALDVVIMF